MVNRLELLKETFPKVLTGGCLLIDSEGTERGLRAMQAAAPGLGLQLQSLEVRSANDFDSAFEAALTGRARRLSIRRKFPSSLIIENGLSATSRQRTTCQQSIQTVSSSNAGGLMSYRPNLLDLFRRAARVRRQDTERR